MKSTILSICGNQNQKAFSEIGEAPQFKNGGFEIVTNEEQLGAVLSKPKTSPDAFIIDSSPIWPGRFESRQEFGGLSLAVSLRRDFLRIEPIIILGVLSSDFIKQALGEKDSESILDSPGVAYLQIPWNADAIEEALKGLRAISEDELSEVVRTYGNVEIHHKEQAHIMGNLINARPLDLKRIHETLTLWSHSIRRFTPHAENALSDFESEINALELAPSSAKAKRRLQQLDAILQNQVTAPSTMIFTDVVPRNPPKGFSRVLVADDMPQDFLINSLESKFGYEVCRPQSMKLSSAKSMFERHRPGVVLADMYFKRSDRQSEIPDKNVGDEFIRFVLRASKESEDTTTRPMVLVTSKAILDEETEIRAGAINCSGAESATNPEYIHRLIWREARSRGITAEESTNASRELRIPTIHHLRTSLKRTSDEFRRFFEIAHSTRERLSPMLKQNPRSKVEDINLLLKLIQRTEAESQPTLNLCRQILETAGRIQIDLGDIITFEVRDVLHNGLLQFSFLLGMIEDVFQSIETLAHRQSGRDKSELKRCLNLIDTIKRGGGVLIGLEQIDAILEKASKKKSQASAVQVMAPTVDATLTPREVINILIAEDNPFWCEQALESVKEAGSLLGEKYDLRTNVFGDTASLLSWMETWTRAQKFGRTVEKERVFIITDLGLPKKASKPTDGGRATQESTASVKNGLKLIKTLTEYRFNIAITILSLNASRLHGEILARHGVTKESIIEKDERTGSLLARRIAQFAEKSQKYVIQRRLSSQGISVFWINGIEMGFSNELNETFSAIHDWCQTSNTRTFSTSEILERRESIKSKDPNKTIQEHIYRIRRKIFERFLGIGQHIDPKCILKLEENDGELSRYSLNAEIAPLDEEEVLAERNAERKIVGIIRYDARRPLPLGALARGLFLEPLEIESLPASKLTITIDSLWIQVGNSANVQELSKQLSGFCTSFYETKKRELPVIVLAEDAAKAKELLSHCPRRTESGIREPIFVDSESDWMHEVITEHERGTHTASFKGLPIIEISAGNDPKKDTIEMLINNRAMRLPNSKVCNIMRLLLKHPFEQVSWSRVQRHLSLKTKITESDRKNWTKRLRALIKDELLVSTLALKEETARRVLESSSGGLKLSAIVIDPN